MKLAIILALLAIPLGATITLDATCGGGCKNDITATSVSSISIAYTACAGCTAIIDIFWVTTGANAVAADITSVVDTVGGSNVFTARKVCATDGSCSNADNAIVGIAHYSILSNSGGSFTATVTFAATMAFVVVHQVSVHSDVGTLAVDATGAISGASSATPSMTTSGNLSASTQFIDAYFLGHSGAGPVTAGTGYTAVLPPLVQGDMHEYKIGGTSGTTETATMNQFGGTPGEFVGVMVTYKEPGGNPCSGVSPTTLSYTIPVDGPSPPAQAISLTRTGVAYTLSNFGGAETVRNVANTTSGTANDTLYAYINGNVNYQASPGSGSTGFDITYAGDTACSITMTYTLVARTNPTYRNLTGSAISTGTSNGEWVHNDHDLIAASAIGSIPGGTTNLLPANGSTVTTPIFNAVGRTCSPVNHVVWYSSFQPMNSDESILYSLGPGGTHWAITYPACVAHQFATFSPTITGIPFPDRFVNNVFYYRSTNTFQKVVYNTSTFAITSTTTVYTFTGADTINTGDTQGMSPDGYISFFANKSHAGDAAHPQLCSIQLSATTPSATEACRDASLEMPNTVSAGVNFTMLTPGFDSRTNKHYIFTNPNAQSAGNNYGGVYSFTPGASVLTFEYYLGIKPEWTRVPASPAANFTSMSCTNALATSSGDPCIDPNQHADVVQDSAGRQYYVPIGGKQDPSVPAAPIIDLSTGANMTLAKAAGGGLDWGFTFLDVANGGVDIGCQRDWCLVYHTDGGPNAYSILSAVANGANTDVTFTAPPTDITTGQPARFVSIAGCTGINGSWAGGSISKSGSVVTIAGVNPTGSCTGSTGFGFNNNYPATSSYRNEVNLFKVSNGSPTTVLRIGNTLGQRFLTGGANGDGYYEQICSLSPRATYVLCNVNGGDVDQGHILVFQTGIIPAGTQMTGRTAVGGKTTLQ